MRTAISIRDLALRLINDDVGAFNTLYWSFHGAIYFNVLRLTKDSRIAEDIVQEVFTCLWEKRHSLDPSLDLSGWLFVVSHHKSISHLKKKLKEARAEAAMSDAVGGLVYIEEGEANSQGLILEKAIEQLSPQRRKVFELCKVQRRSYEQAAIELRLSKHTVKEYLSGAVNFIKDYIKQHQHQPG
jgi:RNA polymerase sigma factor (sigma-70 family)